MGNRFPKKQEQQEENSGQNMVIKPVKSKKRKLLPQGIMVMPVLSFGFSLTTAIVEAENESPFEIVRMSRFPKSVFQLNQTG